MDDLMNDVWLSYKYYFVHINEIKQIINFKFKKALVSRPKTPVGLFHENSKISRVLLYWLFEGTVLLIFTFRY